MTRLIPLLLLASCSNALTDDAIVLIDRELDLDSAIHAVEHYQPHVGVSIAVTRDAKQFATWDTNEKWRVVSVKNGTVFDGDALCVFDENNAAVGAVTHHPSKTIYIADCWPNSRPFILAHEIGHMVGASDCEDGVMTWANPTTVELSKTTVEQLRDIY
jgi:hypothetical protein